MYDPSVTAGSGATKPPKGRERPGKRSRKKTPKQRVESSAPKKVVNRRIKTKMRPEPRVERPDTGEAPIMRRPSPPSRTAKKAPPPVPDNVTAERPDRKRPSPVRTPEQRRGLGSKLGPAPSERPAKKAPNPRALQRANDNASFKRGAAVVAARSSKAPSHAPSGGSPRMTTMPVRSPRVIGDPASRPSSGLATKVGNKVKSITPPPAAAAKTPNASARAVQMANDNAKFKRGSGSPAPAGKSKRPPRL